MTDVQQNRAKPVVRRARPTVRGFSVLVALAVIAYAVSDHPFLGGEPGFGATQGLMVLVGVGVGLSTLLRAKLHHGILLLFLSSVAALGMAEAFVTVFFQARYRSAFERDDRLLYRLRPDCDREFVRSRINGGDAVVYHVDHDGFRGAELEEKGSAVRVVVYGDSFIHAEYCEREKTFPEVLERRLADELGEPVEVVNAGVASYGPDQECLKLEEELPRLEPQLVIVAIFAGNDFGDLLRNKLFRVTDDGELLVNRPIVSRRIEDEFEFERRGSLLKKAIQKTRDQRRKARSQGAEISMDDLLATAEAEYRDYVVEGNDVVTNLFQDYYTADVSLLPHSASARYRVRLMDAVVARMKADAERASVPLVLMLIPHPIDLGVYDLLAVDRERFPDYEPSNLTDALVDIAKRNGLPFLNLFDVYAAHDPEELYFRGGDDHWNEAGQELAATEMAELIQSRGLLKAGN